MAHAEACLHASAELIRKAGRRVGYARPVGELIRKAGRRVGYARPVGVYARPVGELIRKAGRRVETSAYMRARS